MAQNDLTVQLQRALKDYREDVARGVKKAVKKAAKQAKAKLEEKSPAKSGSYRKGWRVKTQEDRGGIAVVIHNQTDYQLTHLLEFGHAKVSGGRVPARAHIRSIEQEAKREVEKNIQEVVGE